jgi:hypothetical protein
MNKGLKSYQYMNKKRLVVNQAFLSFDNSGFIIWDLNQS